MRQGSRENTSDNKTSSIARRQYVLRNMDKYIKWSLKTKGYLKYKDLVEQQNYFKIKVL